MKRRNNRIKTQRLSKKLTQWERLLYEQIGEVDESQNWLELFTPTRIHDLFIIMKSCSDNQLKAKEIQKELRGLGFSAIGEGTNILTMANQMYPGVCFKIALDDYGLADNFNDLVLEELVNEALGEPRFTHVLAKHPSGMITVQERKAPIQDQDRMDKFRDSVTEALATLASDFLIVDLSPSEYHLNYGVNRDGSWCFIDASDLYPLDNLPEKIRCKKAVGYDEKHHKVVRCGGRLRYNGDFSRIVCPDCKGEYIPSEIRPRDKEDKKKMSHAMLDGMSMEERENMRRTEMVRVNGKNIAVYVNEPDPAPAPTPANSDLPTTDNPEEVVVPKPRVEEPTTAQIIGRFKRPDPEPEPAPKPAVDAEELPEDGSLNEFAEAVGEIIEPETPAEEEEAQVEPAMAGAPDPEVVAQLEPVSDNPEPRDGYDSEEDEDEDDDEPHLISTVGEPDEDDTGPDPEEPSPEDDEEELVVSYHIDQDENSETWGININFDKGDPLKALESDQILPLFIHIGDVEYMRAISVEQMRNLLRPVIRELLDDN